MPMKTIQYQLDVKHGPALRLMCELSKLLSQSVKLIPKERAERQKLVAKTRQLHRAISNNLKATQK
jgi:hypothetical protein